jgi:hypothetical protein
VVRGLEADPATRGHDGSGVDQMLAFSRWSSGRSTMRLPSNGSSNGSRRMLLQVEISSRSW